MSLSRLSPLALSKIYFKVDLRTVSFDIPSQEILTKDSVTIRVDAVCYYRKVDATKSVCEVEDADSSTVSKIMIKKVTTKMQK
jgi:regulator of protease activity HflC (stomatin/prohibitin superfamily)